MQVLQRRRGVWVVCREGRVEGGGWDVGMVEEMGVWEWRERRLKLGLDGGV